MEIAKYDYLIVGSGLFGATFAHLATSLIKFFIFLAIKDKETN